VFTYRCPGCGKQHNSQVEVEQPFAVRCLRCGESFHVAEESSYPPSEPSSDGKATTDFLEAVTARRSDSLDASVAADDEAPLPLMDASLEDVLEAVAADGGDDAQSPGARTRRRQRLESDDSQDIQPGRRLDHDDIGEGIAAGARDEPYDGPQSGESEGPNARRTSRVPIIAGLVAGILVSGSLGAYLLFFRAPAKKPTERVARATTKSSFTRVSESPATGKETPEEPPADPPSKNEETPAVPKVDKLVRLSAVRLAAELATNAEETNRRYEHAKFEISGLFDRIDVRETDQPSARPHALFIGDAQTVMCDLLASTTDMGRWRTLLHKQPITVRGEYGKDGVLYVCELLPLTAPAEEKYKGRDVELFGFVQAVFISDPLRAFPTIVLEPETNSRVEVDCLFRKTDADEMRKLQPGVPVTIKGTCNGRSRDDDRYRVRIDNCTLIYTSASVDSTPRFEAAQFFRDYDEDLQPTLQPNVGREPFYEAPLTMSQLAKEVAADPKALDRYRNKLIVVAGKMHMKYPPQTLVLESGNTDQALKLNCLFAPHVFTELNRGPDFRIRGYCSGVIEGQMLRLDNCEPVDDSKISDPRRLNADYLPHVPDRSLTYDIALFPTTTNGAATVVRQVLQQREGGITETVITHSGKLIGKSLLDEEEQSRWSAQRKTQKVRLPGPVQERRISGGFVEIGHHLPTKSTESETAWEPALKLQARTGDSWNWTYANARHKFTVIKFQEVKGRTSVVIEEAVARDDDPDHPSVVRHVYVLNIGEVERQEVLQITSREKRVVKEMKLVEEAGRGPAKERVGDNAAVPEIKAVSPKEGEASPPR
jgi:hypothetical protein